MTVELTADLRWIEECHDFGDGEHKHVSVYLVREDDRSVLVDSGAFSHRDAIVRDVEEATDGRGVDAIVLSHSDYPHSANIPQLRADGEVDLVASSGVPEIQGLSDATTCEIGRSMEIEGREFSFIDPPLADRSHTTWIYDHGSGTLFTADGFGARHRPDECTMTSRDFEDGIPEERIYRFHKHELVWLRYVDPGKLRAALESIFDAYPIEWVAPIHGHPIAGADLDRYTDRLIDAAARIADEYTVPRS